MRDFEVHADALKKEKEKEKAEKEKARKDKEKGKGKGGKGKGDKPTDGLTEIIYRAVSGEGEYPLDIQLHLLPRRTLGGIGRSSDQPIPFSFGFDLFCR